jgi:heat shock protein HtpX
MWQWWVRRGLLGGLSEHEIVGVLAHELSYIKRYDTLIMTISAALAGAIGMLANFLLFFAGGRDNERNHPLGILGGLVIMLLAPLAASLVQLAISRTREFVADKGSAEIAGQPLWLAEARIHIHQSASHIPNREAEHNPATAHLFIVNPLGTTRLDGLFSTHPPVHERVARLRAMSMTQKSK